MAGADSVTSSLTSTSHTLTHAPGMATSHPAASAPKDAASMLAFLDSLKPANRHALVQPSPQIPAASLQFTKAALDAFAAQVSDQQQQRLREAGNSKKRKRQAGGGERPEVLKIRKLHVAGFEVGQVWEQAKRIISSTLALSDEVLKELEENNEVKLGSNGAEDQVRAIEFGEDGFEVSSGEDEDSASASGESASESEDDEESDEIEEDAEEWDDVSEEESEQDGEEGIEGEEDEQDDEGDLNQPSGTFAEDPFGLNDGFFSIDDFNKQTQWFEEQDARGDPNTDQVSDEEVDWNNDPLSAPAHSKKNRSKSRKVQDDLAGPGADSDDSEDEDDGPTFGDMDLYAPEGASEDENEEDPGLEGGLDLTANDIFYKDFFAPPPKKGKKGDKQKRPRHVEHSQADEADVERAMADVRRDLFEDLSEHSDSEDALSDVSAGNPKSRRSAHERRQAKLADEIRRLEAELVAKRAWTMSGEASAVDRPMNSLLEEDLEFEHAGKPVPVITESVSEDIEEMIKRRLLADELDELVRRRPTADLPASTRRGLVELDDTKAQQSLAEIYEEEAVKDANPDTYVSKADEKLQREEKEIEQMWKEVSAKLDALSSWHYKPKPAAPSLTVVADVATVAMEDAQPTTAQGVSGGASMVAPQEVYNPTKEGAEKGEVVAKSGLPVARQEMSREEKLRRRRREKERIRKNGGEEGGKTLGKKAQEKKDTMSELKRGGVKVINRRGEVVDVNGNKPKAAKEASSGSYKL
ncbi:U3 small nucleolar ribonucleoprotein MPP10 [Pleurostoma richardsiae]|uniref:U3 small nucleolar ribonucleoprotein protein MPP10 n=1 Tax=Pleurostoma richardsiae TaxID=41990 RepID=A0AA38SAR9_9PEZI|nr:U3 small nucleolar ribonucleoprotein MPP10 [Pleurostoma richardsiae]